MGTIMQETSATSSRDGVVSANGIDAAIATTTNSADLSSSCCSSRLMNQPSRTAPPAQGLTGVLAYPSSERVVRSDSSDGSSEMSYKGKAQATKGLFCRAYASLKAFAMHKTKNEEGTCLHHQAS